MASSLVNIHIGLIKNNARILLNMNIDWAVAAVLGILLSAATLKIGAAEYYMSLEVDFAGMAILPFLASLKSHFTFIACHLRPCFFTTESTSHRACFMSQINSFFGSRGMTLALNDVQFSALIKGERKPLPN